METLFRLDGKVTAIIGGASAGADEMVSLARQHGKAVYYSLQDVPSNDEA